MTLQIYIHNPIISQTKPFKPAFLNKNNSVEAKNFSSPEKLSSAPVAALQAKYLGFSGKSYLLDNKDLNKLNNFQTQWAKTITINSSEETINPVRLSPIKFADASGICQRGRAAEFCSTSNSIYLNPIKEILEICGGAEQVSIHESVHSYFYNLIRAAAYQDPQLLIGQTCKIISDRMLKGERDYILAGVKAIRINGEDDIAELTTLSPPLSKNDRIILTNFYSNLTENETYKDKFDFPRLNKKGSRILYDSVIPQMEGYNQYLEMKGIKPANIKGIACKNLKEYINAMFYRRDKILANMFAQGTSFGLDKVDFQKNINTPLTETEKIIALDSIDGALSTIEGNYFQQATAGISDTSQMAYLVSYEERVARQNEISYKLHITNKRLSDKGISGAERKLLNSKKSKLENDAKLLNYLAEYINIEQEIISAPKDYKKMVAIQNTAQKGISEYNPYFNGKLDKLMQKYGVPQDPFINCQTDEEIEKVKDFVKSHLPEEHKHLVDDAISDKFVKELEAVEESLSPRLHLQDTPENSSLLENFDGLTAKIKKLAKGSDITGMPKMFFENETDYKAYIEKYDKVFIKWIMKFAHK